MSKIPIQGEEQTFEHTGIRIMIAKNGDLLFCDPGAVTGIRDSLMITTEMRQFHPEWIGRRLLEYIEKHENVRNDEPVTFSYYISSSKV